jgi:hypothetical protein
LLTKYDAEIQYYGSVKAVKIEKNDRSHLAIAYICDLDIGIHNTGVPPECEGMPVVNFAKVVTS